MKIEKYGRNWAVLDENQDLICITVYKKGALEVVKRFTDITQKNKEERKK